MKKIAIQGYDGCFHQIVAFEYFGRDVQTLPCDTFRQVAQMVRSGEADYGVMAIENSIAGSIIANYSILQDANLQVAGEYYLPIEQNLMVLPDVELEDITEVESHPMALLQCVEYLDAQPWRLIETEDTALSAKEIMEHQLRGHAAICSVHAAKLYGMRILQESIETNKHNFTRFLVIADRWRVDELKAEGIGSQPDKANIVFSLPHEEGSLSQILSIFTFYRINLTKIQSLPIIGREWEYMFYVDVTYNDYTRFRQSIDAVRPLTKELTILGEYRAFESHR